MSKLYLPITLILIGIASYFFEFSIPDTFSFEDIGENRFGIILIGTGIFQYLLDKRALGKKGTIDNK